MTPPTAPTPLTAPTPRAPRAATATRRAAQIAGAGLTLLLLGACGSSGSGSAGASAGAPAGSPAGSPASSPASSPAGTPVSGDASGAGGTVVQVSETEFALALSRTDVAAGRVTLQVHNAGHTTHALSVATASGTESTDAIEPGGSASLTVELQPGRTELWCPVGDHKAEGMDTDLTVS